MLDHPPTRQVSDKVRPCNVSDDKGYLSLEVANQQTFEDLSGLVTVANVFERLGCVLAAYIEQDLLTTSVVKSYCQPKDHTPKCRGNR